MGISFRKSIKVGKNTRINISKKGGIGFSTGFKGFRISKNKMGLRLSLGGNGIYYTKWFSKNKGNNVKKKNKKEKAKVRKLKNEEVIEEDLIDPETDFERIPTEDEKALLLYLGSPVRNYLLYFLLIELVGTAIFALIKQDLLSYLIVGGAFLLNVLYLFSKLNYFVFGVNRAISLFQKNRFDKAYKILNKCLNYRPKNEKALILMMFTSFKLEKYDVALDCIEKYRKDNEPLEVMHFIEGYASCELGKYKEGIEAIEKVYSEEDDIRYSKYKILGDCYVGLQEYDRAINWYEELPVNQKKMDENIAEYNYALGNALLLKGNKKRAFNYLMKVYDYKPDYKDIKELISKVSA